MALTPQQQQSVNDSGGYYDANGNWVDLSSSSGAGQGATANTGPSTAAQLAPLASLAPLIINMLKGSSQPNPGALLGTIPGGQDLLNSVVGQQAQQAPLRQAVTQQAMNMLPNSAFPGGRTAVAPVAAGPAPVSSSGGSSVPGLLAAGATGAGLAALLGSLANGGSGAGGPLAPIANALKKLFGGGGSSTPNAFTGPQQETDPGYFSGPQQETDPGYFSGPQQQTDPSAFSGPQLQPNVDTNYNFNNDPLLGLNSWWQGGGMGLDTGGGGTTLGDPGEP